MQSITTMNSSITITVPHSFCYITNKLHTLTHFNISDNLRVTNGVETKGLEVTSDEPISVHIGTEYQTSRIISRMI